MSRNAAFLFVARLVSAGTTVVVLSVVGRLRGADALGYVGIGFALGAIASVASDLGSASLLVREAARRQEAASDLLGAGIVLRLIMLPVVVGSLAATATLVFPAGAAIILVTSLGLAIQQVAELTRAVFYARQRMLIGAVHLIVENVAWLAAIALALVAGATLALAIALGCLVFALSAAVGLALDRALANVTPSVPDAVELRRLVRLVGPFAAFAVVGTTFARVDTFLVGALLPTSAVATAGAYFGAARLVAAFEYVPEVVSRAIYPELARRYGGDPGQLAAVLRPASIFLVACGIPVPVVALLIGDWLMQTLFGPAAAGTGWILVGLSLVAPIKFLHYLFGTTLTSAGAQGRRVAAAVAALFVILAVDAIFIPRIGVVAAIVGNASAWLVVFIAYADEIGRRVGSLGLVRSTALLLAAAGVAAIVPVVLTSSGGPIGTPAVGLLGFLVIYLAVGGSAVGRAIFRVTPG